METRTVILSQKQVQTFNYIPGELVRLLLEFKLKVGSITYTEMTWRDECVTRVIGEFKTIDCRFEFRSNSSHYLEQLEMLLDENRRFEYEVTR